MPVLSGEQVLAAILKHDTKSTSYKIALLRALNDVVLLYPDVARLGQAVAVPLTRLAELWVAYYWPFMDAESPIYQGARALRDDATRNDVAFRLALTKLRVEWQRLVQLAPQPADGFFLLTEMRTPHRLWCRPTGRPCRPRPRPCPCPSSTPGPGTGRCLTSPRP
ncbi:MAG TPA: hypothetical protein VF629_03865 [Hymenobacter sp.]|uniref:hypothetical protein n=1 Tax=Hymenobacter sp. TaxID=1898978 RepID=UPI002EDA7FC5